MSTSRKSCFTPISLSDGQSVCLDDMHNVNESGALTEIDFVSFTLSNHLTSLLGHGGVTRVWEVYPTRRIL